MKELELCESGKQKIEKNLNKIACAHEEPNYVVQRVEHVLSQQQKKFNFCRCKI